MPSATQELSDEWCSDDNAISFLNENGYVLSIPSYTWVGPGRDASPKERRAILYLITEWDFGGLQ